ncbi:unnamed protein product [Cuscuta europaea]|uniref:Glutaredoxin domain-containing protein n=1 Tax=Cuscuta europaea TaxID=41803 RepID=A0A9P0Z8C2_CUSEU|nr:unnamed protein product [Cuscuta europaea]
MGCANSKRNVVCENCHAPFSPGRRSLDSDRPPRRKAETHPHHVVALTSSTLGSIRLDPLNKSQALRDAEDGGGKLPMENKIPEISAGGELETIDAWELMKDLEDCARLVRSFSSPASTNLWSESISTLGSNDTSVGFLSEFDPDVIESFRKALSELPPASPKSATGDKEKTGEAKIETEHNKNRVIFYFTSIRGVRKTYEDCCNVRSILEELKLKIEDRDVSMHSGFKEELKEIFGEDYSLPRVFVGKKYIGGEDEIRRMHEEGKLKKLVDCCEKVEESGGGGGGCETCGNIRFVPCDTCKGSCKVFCECGNGSGFERCPDCNENGLIRCPICCDY